jgi:glucose-6-phosphate 1-epimerase
VSNRFATIVTDVHGLDVVRVHAPFVQGEMYLHGGQVMSWRPSGAEEVLFVSGRARWETDRAIRGGVPVCFPWFGPHPTDASAPAHGCVRTRPWQLAGIDEGEETVTVNMFTVADEVTRRWWPSSFRLEHRVSFGSALTLELVVTNTGDAVFTFEEALHTYFAVQQVQRARVSGLDGIRYLDTLDAGHEKPQAGAITFTAETDRIYLDPPSTVRIEDHPRRSVRLATDGAAAAVVWNPWIGKARMLADLDDEEWPRFVCVETCNVKPRAVTLAAGERHSMRVAISIESM